MQISFTGAGGHRVGPCYHSSWTSSARQGCAALPPGSQCSRDACADGCLALGLQLGTSLCPVLHVPGAASFRASKVSAREQILRVQRWAHLQPAVTLPAPFVQCIFPQEACVEVGDSSKNRARCPAPRTRCPFQHRITYRLIDEGRLHTAFSASKEFALKSWVLHSKLHTFLAISSQALQCLGKLAGNIAGKLVTLDHGAGNVCWVVQQEGDDGDDSSEIIEADTSFLFCQFSL